MRSFLFFPQLAEQLAEAKRHLVVSQDTEAALVKKVNAYQKTVAALMAKFEDYVAMTSAWRLAFSNCWLLNRTF